ncbi:Cystathionine gamma-synthase [Ophidiomyces ophidiicola]|nr:Cystathionine gamma-synthase [Ophidiomyces ophidiicola]
MAQNLALGESIPPNTSHAVSVSLPTWKANVGYEEGEEWVVHAMSTGYPRFFFHKSIQDLSRQLVQRFGYVGESIALFPSLKATSHCRQFMLSRVPTDCHKYIRLVRLAVISPFAPLVSSEWPYSIAPGIFCVFYPERYAGLAKQVWQHSGEGISSRCSEFYLKLLVDGFLSHSFLDQSTASQPKDFPRGPKRYQNCDRGSGSTKEILHQGWSENLHSIRTEGREFDQFIEERFGRNLNPSLAHSAKLAVKRRISGSITATVGLSEALETSSSSRRIDGLTDDHVYLYPSGMSSIFNSHQTLLAARGPMKSICFGFPYIDTLKILEKWGPGVVFYGHGSPQDINDLESRLEAGERFLALFTEFPGNPLLRSPDLRRIYALGAKYDFAVVVDESLGNFINVNVIPYADIVVSSLTKIFSGDSNVMGGSAVYNPHSQYYQALKGVLDKEYEDNYWHEDAIFLERNSRDFISRIQRINASTEAITARLKASPLVKEIFYPKYSPTKHLYDICRNPKGGYGGLFSITFWTTTTAMAFFDALNVMKGPSLGTNFTLSSPYTLLAHYGELEWANSFGVASDLVRISVGLEDVSILESIFDRALDATRRVASS